MVLWIHHPFIPQVSSSVRMVLMYSGQTQAQGGLMKKERAEKTHCQGSPFLLPVSAEWKQKILIFHLQIPESCSFAPPPWGSSCWSIPVSACPVPELSGSLQASQFPKVSPALVPAEELPATHQCRPQPLQHFPGAALVRNGAQALWALLFPTALQQLQLMLSVLDSGHSTLLKDHNPETPLGYPK